jgi:uncharacterized protein YndB with AHSA1/START domain
MLAVVRKTENGYIAKFERHLKHSVEKVWASITEPEMLGKWLAAAKVDLREGGHLELSFDLTEGNAFTGKITELKQHDVFEFEWGTELVRFELYPEEGGCLLVLKQIFEKVSKQTPMDLAGWHEHLNVLIAGLSGQPTLFSYANWETIHQKYAQVLDGGMG